MSKKLKDIKNYWNRQPCNINHSNEPSLNKKYFTEVKKKKYYVEKHILKFADFKKYNNNLYRFCNRGNKYTVFVSTNFG